MSHRRRPAATPATAGTVTTAPAPGLLPEGRPSGRHRPPAADQQRSSVADQPRSGRHRQRGRHRHGGLTTRPLAHPALVFVPAVAVAAGILAPAAISSGTQSAARAYPRHWASAIGPAVITPVTMRPQPPLRQDQTPDAPAQQAPTAREVRKAAAERRSEWVRPDVGPLTSGYGYRPSMGDFHPGIDLAGPYGSPIRAAAAGRIVFAGPASGFGQMIRIVHPGGIATVYGHMSRILRWHGHVRAGQVIALEGSEGHSTGPHLHFEVYVHGVRQDPQVFLEQHGVHV